MFKDLDRYQGAQEPSPHRFQELESQLESGGAPETPPRLCPAVTTPTPSRSVTRHGPQQALGSGGRQDDSRRDETGTIVQTRTGQSRAARASHSHR